MCCMLSCFSHAWLFGTPWTVAHEAPLSVGFSVRNTGVGCHVLLQGVFLIQGWNLCLLSPALAARFFTTRATWEAWQMHYRSILSFDRWMDKKAVCVCVYLEPICFLSTLGNLKKKGWTSPDFIMNFPWLFLFLSTLFLNFFFNIYFGCIKS